MEIRQNTPGVAAALREAQVVDGVTTPAPPRAMRPHVGIVACSAEGAALCYRTFCAEGAASFGEHAHPDVSLHSHCLADYMVCVRRGDWRGVADLMLSSARRLRQAGAELLVCPDNTIHQAFEIVERESPAPWLHIARVVASEAKRRGHTRLGILGTKYLMEGPVYSNACNELGLVSSTPDKPTRESIDRTHIERAGLSTRAATLCTVLLRRDQSIARPGMRGGRLRLHGDPVDCRSRGIVAANARLDPSLGEGGACLGRGSASK